MELYIYISAACVILFGLCDLKKKETFVPEAKGPSFHPVSLAFHVKQQQI